MPPKKPDQLKKELEEHADDPSEPGRERTAEGMETRTPSRREFFGNLEKVSQTDDED